MFTKSQLMTCAIAVVMIFNLFTPVGNVFAATSTITVAEAIANNSGAAVVEGYIVGTTETSSLIGAGDFSGPFTISTNLLLADTPNETDITKCIPVQLPSGDVRTALNLVDHTENEGKLVQLTGSLEAYYGVAGLKNVSAYNFMTRDYITVSEAIINNSGNNKVLGYIVGTSTSTSSLGSGDFDAPFTITYNLLLADSPTERDITKVIPVQLPSGNIRTALNLVDNPTNLGKRAKISGTLTAYFSVPGLKSVTAYEFVTTGGGTTPTPTPEPTPDPIPDPTSGIAAARTQIGQTVTVEGIVNIDNGLLQAGKLSVYMQDGTAGIQLYNASAVGFPALKAGDKVSATGVVGEYNGVIQLAVSSVQVLATNQSVAVKNALVSDYNNATTAESYEGQLVKMEGYVLSVPSAYEFGGANISFIDANLNTVIVRVWESTGINLANIQEGKWYNLTAISSQYNTTYQVLPRSIGDFSLSAVQNPNPVAAGTEIRATVASIVDGDTIKLTSPVLGATSVRFVNIDTPETYHTVANSLDQDQLDHGLVSKAYLGTMLTAGQEVNLRLGGEALDGYGRLLAEVITLDGVNTNYEMVRSGNAYTYFIYPFENAQVELYGNALAYARDNQLNIWDPKDPLEEPPFVFRARYNNSTLYRPTGSYITKTYVDASQWESIAPEHRVFFNTEADAATAGYTKVAQIASVTTIIFPWVRTVL